LCPKDCWKETYKRALDAVACLVACMLVCGDYIYTMLVCLFVCLDKTRTSILTLEMFGWLIVYQRSCLDACMLALTLVVWLQEFCGTLQIIPRNLHKVVNIVRFDLFPLRSEVHVYGVVMWRWGEGGDWCIDSVLIVS